MPDQPPAAATTLPESGVGSVVLPAVLGDGADPGVLEPTIWLAEPGDAAAIVAVVHAAFAARPVLDPPASADSETVETITEHLRAGSGVTAWVGDRLAGVVLVVPDHEGVGPEVATLLRVSVHPEFQGHGFAARLVAAAHRLAADLGCTEVRLFVRREFPALQAWWLRQGYHELEPRQHGALLARRVPLVLDVDDAAQMQRVGERLAGVLRAGDVLLAEGPLGAGKTTLAQGIGRGLGVSDAVVSPTFVLSRVHPPQGAGPGLVHVDAYRLGSAAELDDLDLTSSAASHVLLVEWGRGRAEQLSPDRLEIDIARPPGAEARVVVLTPVGRRWSGLDLLGLLTGRHDDPAAVPDLADGTGARAEEPGRDESARDEPGADAPHPARQPTGRTS